MIETNTFVGGGLPNVSDRTVAALWLVTYALGGAARGMSGLNLQIGPAGHSNSPIIMGPGPHVSGLRPAFSGLFLLSLLGHGTLVDAAVLGVPKTMNIFCIQHTQRQFSVILVNLSDTAVDPVSIKAAAHLTSCETLLLQGDCLLSASCRLGGETLNTYDSQEPR